MNKNNLYIAVIAFVVLTAFGVYLWQTQTPAVVEQPKPQEQVKVTPPAPTPEQEAAAEGLTVIIGMNRGL